MTLQDRPTTPSSYTFTTELDVSYSSFNVSYTDEPIVYHEGDIRLVDGTSPNNGRIEILHSGQWGSICDDELGDDDDNEIARVICRQLNLPDRNAYPIKGAFFGESSGPIWMDNVKCKGFEPGLADCKHNGWGRHNCLHNEDAGVNCTGHVRLTEGHLIPTKDPAPSNTNYAGNIAGATVAGCIIIFFLIWFLVHKFKIVRKIRNLISPSPPSSQRPSIVVVSNKRLYDNDMPDMPDEAWGSTITMIHPLFQAFSVSCNVGSIPEGTAVGRTQDAGAGYSQASQFSLNTFESSADTTCGARHLQGLFKGLQSPSLTSTAHSSLEKDRQHLNKEEITNSKQGFNSSDKPIGQKGLGNIKDSDHVHFCLEENAEAKESGDFSDDTRKGSSDSSDLDLTEPVVSVSRFHYLI